MICAYCGQGKGRRYTRDEDGTRYYYFCQDCVGTFKNELLPHGLLEFLESENPYPKDLFKMKVGKAARTGYNACIYNIKRFLEALP